VLLAWASAPPHKEKAVSKAMKIVENQRTGGIAGVRFLAMFAATYLARMSPA
jgi:hypothetical protein